MKATGIVRRIDELGRVVIPKEIRRTQRIRQGDALEIFAAADGQVVFKKYSPLVELGELAGVYAEVLAKNLGRPVLVCDRESIVAATGTHGLDLREVDDHLVNRSDLVVEGRGSAERENGNLATAWSAADWRERPPANLRDLALGRMTRAAGRPALYTGVGMSWEDLVCATAAYAAYLHSSK